jgi:hypothetical protein
MIPKMTRNAITTAQGGLMRRQPLTKLVWP